MTLRTCLPAGETTRELTGARVALQAALEPRQSKIVADRGTRASAMGRESCSRDHAPQSGICAAAATLRARERATSRRLLEVALATRLGGRTQGRASLRGRSNAGLAILTRKATGESGFLVSP